MARVVFTANLQRHVPTPVHDVQADTVADALAGVFSSIPALRGYILDDQGALRKHVFVFVDGRRLTYLDNLDAAINPASEIYVMQALTGG